MWRLKKSLVGKCIYVEKKVEFCGIRAQVRDKHKKRKKERKKERDKGTNEMENRLKNCTPQIK